MIEATIYASAERSVPCGFRVINHGRGIVCAAVSMLCQNTVNCLEALTDSALEYCYDEKGGYLECLLPGVIAGNDEAQAVLLLQALVFGLRSVHEEYGGGKDGIQVNTKEPPYMSLPNKKSTTRFSRGENYDKA